MSTQIFKNTFVGQLGKPVTFNDDASSRLTNGVSSSSSVPAKLEIHEDLLTPNAETSWLIQRRSVLVDVFDGDEAKFAIWKWQLVHHLTRMNLQHTLVSTPLEEKDAVADPKATPAQEAARKERYHRRCEEDDAAMDEICNTIIGEPLQKIGECTYAKECMDVLVRIYQCHGSSDAKNVRQNLYTIDERPFYSLEELIAFHSKLCIELDRADPTSHMEKIQTLLAALPKRFDRVVDGILVLPVNVLKQTPLEHIHRLLHDEEARQYQPSRPLHSTKVDRKKTRCFECNSIGHHRFKCPLWTKKKLQKHRERLLENRRNEKKGNINRKRTLSCTIDPAPSKHILKQLKR